MPPVSAQPHTGRAGFTILEVLVAALLIGITTGSIMTMNARALHVLRASHLAAASSQVLQQRIEMVRAHPWPEIASSTALATLMATATESEKELGGAQMIETIQFSVPQDPPNTPTVGGGTFTMSRTDDGTVTEVLAGDLTSEPTLLVDSSITWLDHSGPHRRFLRTVICRAGLTRSGIFGSALGRPTSGSPPPGL